MFKILFVTAAIALTATSAAAASFDCDKAAAPDEQAICANRSLNEADVRMTTMFEMEVDLVAMGERDTLRNTQKLWLEKRTACKADTACLAAAYDQRIAELKKIFADIAARGTR